VATGRGSSTAAVRRVVLLLLVSVWPTPSPIVN
jgi:hypothetical protein